MQNEELQELKEAMLIRFYDDLNKYSNNRIWIIGTMAGDIKLSHEVKGEKFYQDTIRTRRKSSYVDEIVVVFSELDLQWIALQKYAEKKVEIKGKLRSFNEIDSKGDLHVKIYVLVKEIQQVKDEEEDREFAYLEGRLCRKPIYNISSLSKRKLTELCVEINRPYGKSDYIISIAWGKNAHATAKFEVDDVIQLYGRLQERKYFKKNSENDSQLEERKVYEISIAEVVRKS